MDLISLQFFSFLPSPLVDSVSLHTVQLVEVIVPNAQLADLRSLQTAAEGLGSRGRSPTALKLV